MNKNKKQAVQTLPAPVQEVQEVTPVEVEKTETEITILEKIVQGLIIANHETGEEQLIRYLEGSPKSYRADCQVGQFKLGESKFLGNTFTFRPIAYRLFNAALWADVPKNIRRDWIELFFIDESNAVSAIVFHGISRNNLEKVLSETFYEGFGLCESIVECSMEKKTSKESGNPYFVVNFELTESPDRDTQIMLGEAIKPFRRDSISTSEVMQFSMNYGLQTVSELPEHEEGEQDHE